MFRVIGNYSGMVAVVPPRLVCKTQSDYRSGNFPGKTQEARDVGGKLALNTRYSEKIRATQVQLKPGLFRLK